MRKKIAPETQKQQDGDKIPVAITYMIFLSYLDCRGF